MSSDIFLLAMVSMEIDICSKEKGKVGGGGEGGSVVHALK